MLRRIISLMLILSLVFLASASNAEEETQQTPSIKEIRSGYIYIDGQNNSRFLRFLKNCDRDKDGKLTDAEILEIYNMRYGIDESSRDWCIQFIPSSGELYISYLYPNMDPSLDLRTLDLSGCLVLKTVSINDVPFAMIDLSGCKRIETCSITDNDNLTSVNFKGCKKMNALWCTSNAKLTKINLKGCSQVRQLDCSNNNLSALDVTPCKEWLLELNCSGNRIKKLKLDGLNLHVLDCRDNRLTSITYSRLSYRDAFLTTLYCDNNKLKKMEILGCFHFEELSCKGNKLKSINLKGSKRPKKFSRDKGVKIVQ